MEQIYRIPSDPCASFHQPASSSSFRHPRGDGHGLGAQTYGIRIVRYRRLAGVCGQYALGLAGAWIVAEGEVRGPSSPRWSCARWTARTGLRRRRRSSCRSTITPSTRATSSSTRCRRRWSIATDAPRADDCSARQRTWTVFPTAITSRSVLSPEDRLRGDAAASSALDNRGILSRGLRDANSALWLLES